MLRDDGYEFFDKIVILLAADTFASPADIERISAQFRIVRSHIDITGSGQFQYEC